MASDEGLSSSLAMKKLSDFEIAALRLQGELNRAGITPELLAQIAEHEKCKELANSVAEQKKLVESVRSTVGVTPLELRGIEPQQRIYEPAYDPNAAYHSRRERERNEDIETARLQEIARLEVRDEYEAAKTSLPFAQPAAQVQPLRAVPNAPKEPATWGELVAFRKEHSDAVWTPAQKNIAANEKAARNKRLAAKGVANAMAGELGVTVSRLNELIRNKDVGSKRVSRDKAA